MVFAAGAVAAWETWRSNTTTPEIPIVETKPLPEPLSYATKPEVGYLAPNFSLKTIDGRDVRLADYLGQVVIVNFWASWCPFCKTQYPTLVRYGQLTTRDVVILSINRAELDETVTTYMASQPGAINFAVLLDPTDVTYPAYKAKTMPYLVFIDRDGVIRAIGDREMTLSEINTAALPLRQAKPACWQDGLGRTC
jgi:thiol-disulfide isomerase/thioredoxin